jgi:hypothetical protein
MAVHLAGLSSFSRLAALRLLTSIGLFRRIASPRGPFKAVDGHLCTAAARGDKVRQGP